MSAKTLKLADVLAAGDRQPVSVDVPEWHGKVHLRPMSGNDRDRIDVRFAGGSKSPDKAVGLRATVVAACLCDEKGEHWPLTKQDTIELGEKSGAVLDRLFDRACELSGFRDKDVEKLEGN